MIGESISLIADFMVLSVSSFESSVGQSKYVPETGSFLLPADAAMINEQAILAFLADPSTDADDLAYEIRINENRIRSGGQFSGGGSRGGILPLQEDSRGLHSLAQVAKVSLTFTYHWQVRVFLRFMKLILTT